MTHTEWKLPSHVTPINKSLLVVVGGGGVGAAGGGGGIGLDWIGLDWCFALFRRAIPGS